jgi:hypothetical protein
VVDFNFGSCSFFKFSALQRYAYFWGTFVLILAFADTAALSGFTGFSVLGK